MISATAPDWKTHIDPPDPTQSADLLEGSKAVFDQAGRVWMVQASPGATPDAWNLMLYTLAPNATNWSAPIPIPAESARAEAFNLGMDARGRVVVTHIRASSDQYTSRPLSVSRFDPATSTWTNLSPPNFSVVASQLHVDAPGNIWVFQQDRYGRYDDKTGIWTESAELDYVPVDAAWASSHRGAQSLPIATDSQGNAWTIGARRKSLNEQDLPILWINRFDASTGLWGEPASLNVTEGEDRRFLAYEGDRSRYFVSMAMDAEGRPVALVTEAVETGFIGLWLRSWITRGPASDPLNVP
ncbi:hypothetical protein [Ottowia thiooxydans]|uniref:Uncharacterized protein n=1 Tax=Ottowia thiooxydans TaxID=219182 RepID=A0ABV2Q467_9BURK